MPPKINLYQIGVWFCVGFFHQCRLGDCGVARRADFICRLNASEVRGTAAGKRRIAGNVSIAVGVLRLGFLG
jgi:hypothetical protein